jgi:hypothetical protein
MNGGRLLLILTMGAMVVSFVAVVVVGIPDHSGPPAGPRSGSVRAVALMIEVFSSNAKRAHLPLGSLYLPSLHLARTCGLRPPEADSLSCSSGSISMRMAAIVGTIP